jgi:hypothetical protein
MIKTSDGAVILAEGAVIERLRRDSSVELDPHVENAGLIYDPAGSAVLESIYREYIDIGQEFRPADHHLHAHVAGRSPPAACGGLGGP